MSILWRNIRSIFATKLSSSVRQITMYPALSKEAVETLGKNPYFDKYAGKLLEKQKVAPEEFSSLLDNLKNEKEKQKQNVASVEETINPLPAGQPRPAGSNPLKTSTKTLNDILKLDKVKNEEPQVIEQMWLEYHKTKDSTIAASVPVNIYETLIQKSKKFPIFLVALPRNQGYEFIMLQFNGNEVHFTPLISYQTHKENAPGCLTLVYYSDLKEEKNLILLRGEYDKNVINAMEAQCLANQIQLYYGENDEKRTKLMERFTNHPDEFQHMDLIGELNTLSI
ncbi:ATP synthase mitochondrial F1 complex assembly factor 1 [Planococcus citri]|uniref:ATP synthase mitochondrial F1 complex assembly factor 1 n=1 Tax=Planococcus citri TaxID=170843 RepID=UPI0031F7ABA3